MSTKLANMLAKMEGGKSQAKIGDIRQVIRLMEDFFAKEMVSDEGILIGPMYGELINKIYKKAKAIRAKNEKAKAKTGKVSVKSKKK